MPTDRPDQTQAPTPAPTTAGAPTGTAGADPDLARFQAEVRAFLAGHVPTRGPATVQGWGQGPDEVSAVGSSDTDGPDGRRRAQAWRALLFDAGYGWISGPTE
ncbi:MAG: hypothetical protein ACK5PP_18885 [Acidimicrobiales bacterium]